jgi:hypothetical protein
MYKRNIEARSRNHFCRRKVVSIKYSDCVSVALVAEHAIPMRRICINYLYFSALTHKMHDFLN